MIVAVDGPLASGKGTIAKALAQRFGFHYLDTGMLYRAVGLGVLAAGDDPADPRHALAAARQLDPDHIDPIAARTLAAGAAASRVATIPEVREHLLEFQREFARRCPGAVLDGRDIGTVVCPEANLKLFVTASETARARRRLQELRELGEVADFESVLSALRERDARDTTRLVAPLRAAPDAHLLDTTDFTIDEAIEAACRLVDNTRQTLGAAAQCPECEGPPDARGNIFAE